MRVDVEKVLMVGPWQKKKAFFAKVQERGWVEFLRRHPVSLEVPHEIETYSNALHVLRTRMPVKEAPPGRTDKRSAIVIAQHINEVSESLEHLYEKERILRKEITRVEVFGNFSWDDLHQVEEESQRVFQFFFAKHPELVEAVSRPEVLFVGRENGLSYFVAINSEKVSYEGLIEIIIERPLGELEAELAEVVREIDVKETDLARYSHHKRYLREGMIAELNRHNLQSAQDEVEQILEGHLFAIEAWVPKTHIEELKKIGENYSVHLELVAEEKQDKRPTYLENKRFGRLGEDLVNIYDTPSPFDRDPSLWVFFAFGIFFSMIVADAGYGLILLAISLFLFWKFGKKGGFIRRVLLLSTSLSIGCIIWGIMLPSFLGIDCSPDSKWRSLSPVTWAVEKKTEYVLKHKGPTYEEIVDKFPSVKGDISAKNFLMGAKKLKDGREHYVAYNDFQDNFLIELAIFIGAIHIITSFIRYLDRNWAGIGWVIFIIGGYLHFPLVIKAISLIHYIFGVPYVLGGQIGLILIFSGLGLAVVLAVIQKRLGGLGEIMHVINVFADIMSYLRIYALSLAGMIMASTFDTIGLNMPIYLGIWVFLAGHSINFTLSLMGGVIHGLRLNFIEWYHYSFEGGGRLFKPLKKIKLDLE